MRESGPPDIVMIGTVLPNLDNSKIVSKPSMCGIRTLVMIAIRVDHS